MSLSNQGESKKNSQRQANVFINDELGEPSKSAVKFGVIVVTKSNISNQIHKIHEERYKQRKFKKNQKPYS